VAKAIICGADAVVVDIPLLLALECRICLRCEQGLPCPVEIENVHPKWGKTRIINLMAAWRNQLLEVLGAMGLREVRRLRGEVGRAMFFEDLEAQTFGKLFGLRNQEIGKL
jgi:glutamate synthase domain-containing protein 2